MNPYMNYNQYTPPYVAPQPIQHVPQPAEPKVVSYSVESAEQLSGIVPMPNTIYLGMNLKDGRIFLRRMNNDGLTEVKTFSLVGEQTRKTDTQEILDRITNIERKLSIGGIHESNVIDVTE